jgi:hypothetical protein
VIVIGIVVARFSLLSCFWGCVVIRSLILFGFVVSFILLSIVLGSRLFFYQVYRYCWVSKVLCNGSPGSE